MTDDPRPGRDGFYHPASEKELACLVRKARRDGVQLRVRGSAHSMARAIYTDSIPEKENVVHRDIPSRGGNMDVMLDEYRGWEVVDREKRLIQVLAGTHLGKNPRDPAHRGQTENGLVYQLEREGWALDNLGGTTHQTISGFTSTGSAGASVQHDFANSLYGFRIIDGRGEVHEITRSSHPRIFAAATVSFGLLGVISTVILRCRPAFEIEGRERFTSIPDCPIDLFGPGDEIRPSLRDWLVKTEFGRIEWWPQRGVSRVEIWQASTVPAGKQCTGDPYRPFGDRPILSQLGICLFLGLFDDPGNPLEAIRRLRPAFRRAGSALTHFLIGEGLPRLASTFAGRAASLLLLLAAGILGVVLYLLRGPIRRIFPRLFGWVLDLFVPLDSQKSQQAFCDRSWRGLPMDAEADDMLIPVDFTEAWIPLSRTQDVMTILRDYFDAPRLAHEGFERTGTLSWEIYAAPPSSAWMSPSYSDGSDEWKDGVVRIDPFWFGYNARPSSVIFEPFWRLLRDRGIPFRLHWAKHQPDLSTGDPEQWTPFFAAQYPHWRRFLRLRAWMDPDGVFLTSYWRERLGIG